MGAFWDEATLLREERVEVASSLALRIESFERVRGAQAPAMRIGQREDGEAFGPFAAIRAAQQRPAGAGTQSGRPPFKKGKPPGRSRLLVVEVRPGLLQKLLGRRRITARGNESS